MATDPEILAIGQIEKIFKTLKDSHSITRVLNFSLSKEDIHYDPEQRAFVPGKNLVGVVERQQNGGVVHSNVVVPNQAQVGVPNSVPQGQNIQGQQLS